MEVYLDRQAPKNRHRLWNYYALAQDMMDDFMKATENKRIKKMFEESDIQTKASLNKKFGSIASETTSTVTCDYAYRHLNKDWIIYGDDLNDDWFKSRVPIMLGQLRKAAVRLAHLLDVVAGKFFAAVEDQRLKKVAEMAKEAAAHSKKTDAGSKPSNFFSALNELMSDEEDTLVGTLSEEDIASVERTPLVVVPKVAKKKAKPFAKPVEKLSDAEIDKILKDFKKRVKKDDAAAEAAEKLRKVVKAGKTSSADPTEI
jgi:hypothetical protein